MVLFADWWVDFQCDHHPDVVKWLLPDSVTFILHRPVSELPPLVFEHSISKGCSFRSRWDRPPR